MPMDRTKVRLVTIPIGTYRPSVPPMKIKVAKDVLVRRALTNNISTNKPAPYAAGLWMICSNCSWPEYSVNGRNYFSVLQFLNNFSMHSPYR